MSEIKRGAVLSYATVAFNAVAGLIYTPWMVSTIGTDDYALYTLALSIVNFFLLDFGLGDSVSRFLSRYYANGETEFVPVFLGIVYRLFAALAFVLALVFVLIWINADAIYSNLGPEALSRFKVVFAIVSAYSVLAFPFTPLKGILVANEQFVALNACNFLQKICTVLLIVACLLLGWGVYALVTVNALCAFAFVSAKWIIVRRRTTAHARFGVWDSASAKSIFSFSMWVTLVQLFQRMVFAIAPTVIAALSNAWEVAIFGLAASLEGYVWSIASALNGMFMPKVARIKNEGGSEGLQRLMVRVGRIQLMIIGLVITGFAAFGQRFVDCWMGEGYNTLYLCALLLIIPSLFELPQLIGDTALVVGSGVRSKVLAYSVMAVVNLAGLLVLVGSFGSLGAASSICFAYLLRTALMDVAYVKKLGIRIREFFVDVYGRWVLAVVPFLLFSSFSSNLISAGGWLVLVVMVIVYSLLYCIDLYGLYMNGEERIMLKSIVTKLGQYK